MRTDQHHECLMDAIREREAEANAPGACYIHGLRIGRAIELALCSLEVDRVAMDPGDIVTLGEGIEEACWDALRDELGSGSIHFQEVARGLRQSSPRYAAAFKQWSKK
jgi:hypothetical protein